ncbi:MAG: hypothetical protein COB16_03340 [Rhodobacteraceae bacterium]|nr:MAG: hypothetical protein COB16_03340 [Paracoccaceae bacterium]
MTEIFSTNLLTPEQVSDYLGVSVETLNVWRCTKRYNLPYLKVGRLVRYLRIPEHPTGHSDTIRPPKPGYSATLV